MKRAVLSILCLIAIQYFANAQTSLTYPSKADTTDPYLGNYIIGNSAELIFQYVDPSGVSQRQIYDFDSPEGFQKSYQETDIDTLNISTESNTEVITGDFNGDYADDIISAWYCSNNTILLSLPEISKDDLSWSKQKYFTVSSVSTDQIRLISCDFDTLHQQEFLLSFMGTDDKIHINLYQCDSLFNISMIGEIITDKLMNTVYCLDRNLLYDIATGDFDGDGLDELVIVNPYQARKLSQHLYNSISKICVYDYNPTTRRFIPGASEDLTIEYSLRSSSVQDLDFDRFYYNGVAVTTGDFNLDGIEEVAFVLEISLYRYKAGLNDDKTLKAFELNTFGISGSNLIDNAQYTEIYHDDWWANYTKTHSTSVCSADLNFDGSDEVITYTGKYLTIYDMRESIKKVKQINAFAKYGFNSPHSLRVADIDADTSMPKKNCVPEIALFEFVSNGGQISIYTPVLSDSGKIIDIVYKYHTLPGISGDNIMTSSIALGDFDGDGLRLGKPIKVLVNDVFVPTFIECAPPSHFDILNDIVYNVNYLWITPVPRGIENSFTQISDITKKTDILSLKTKFDWGVSRELGFSLNGFTASIDAGYKGAYAKTNSTTNVVTFTNINLADKDDWLYGSNTQFYLFEYPVFYKGHKKGNFLVSTPVVRPLDKIGDWKGSKDLNFNTFSIAHEIGNLLSYPSNIENSPYFKVGNTDVYKIPARIMNNNPQPLSFYDFVTIQEAVKAVESSVSFGFEAAYKGPMFSGKIKGNFDYGKIGTCTVTMQNDFSAGLKIGNIDTKIGDVRYNIKPYIYYAESGQAMVDFAVELIGDWWEDNYGTKPDPAFIMPYRYDPEKEILADNAKRTLTSDIRYFPFDANPGDTITVMATVRNFCINDMIENVKVKFYLGDPALGGMQIKSVDGDSVFNFDRIVPRGSSTPQTFRWAAPSGISYNSYLFGVIDPDNDIPNEIHDDNNKGWIRLFHSDGYPIITSIKQYPNYNIKLINYPNPAKNETMISFYTEGSRRVYLKIYNSMGQKQQSREIYFNAPGTQYIKVDLGNFIPGIYLCEVISEQDRGICKIIVE
jgi:hypothetical protein